MFLRIAVAAGLLAFAGTALADDNETLIKYYRKKNNLPPSATISVSDVKESAIKGAKQGTLNVGGQKVGFVASPDLRYVVFGELDDVTIDPSKAVMEKISLSGEPFKGGKDAKVTIIEYSDFQCPFCAKANTIVEEEVLKQYGDKVRFVYKQYPLIQIHPWAEAASLVGLCVNKIAGSDAYWKYHSAVFAKAEGIEADGANDKLLALAKEAGADQAKVKDCLEKGETKAAVAASMAEAESIGVNSTPTFFVNGRRLAGAMPLDAFKAIIEPELQKGS